jgi:uncharacterized protein (TIGR02270 family)
MQTSDSVVDPIVAQHAEQASFLWTLYARAGHAPHLTLRELARLSDRIDAHLDGLRVAGEAGWKACEAPIAEADPGGFFTRMVLAIEAKDAQRIDAILSLADAAPLQAALISAFGWISASFLQGTVKGLLNSTSPFRRRVGIACCVMHGADPGQALRVAVTDEDPILRATALSAVGELGRTDLDAMCNHYLNDQDAVCRFDAARSAVLLGNRGAALEALTRIGLEPAASRASAFRLMLQAISVSASHAVLQQVAGDPQRLRWLIEGSGIAGDPKYVPWLIGHMTNQKTARLAGEAFGLIAGVEHGDSKLGGERPKNLESGPNDDPEDPNVDMDPDEGLPWPDPRKIEDWWASNNRRFTPGTRYFKGAPITREHCIAVLKNGLQRQRVLAAHYLCLLDPGTPLFNTSAPAWRQQRLLAKMG